MCFLIATNWPLASQMSIHFAQILWWVNPSRFGSFTRRRRCGVDAGPAQICETPIRWMGHFLIIISNGASSHALSGDFEKSTNKTILYVSMHLLIRCVQIIPCSCIAAEKWMRIDCKHSWKRMEATNQRHCQKSLPWNEQSTLFSAIQRVYLQERSHLKHPFSLSVIEISLGPTNRNCWVSLKTMDPQF